MRGMVGANWRAPGLELANPSSAPPGHLLPQGEKGLKTGAGFTTYQPS